MDKFMKRAVNHIKYKDWEVFLPMPVFPVIEDVGWRQGLDGSAVQQPYRNAFPRYHCLADYQALVRLANRLGVRIGLGMVLCEWDRNNLLKGVKGGTWMGSHWNNQENLGPWLDEVTEYLRDQQGSLELGLHALCHEFWHEGEMERSEFHDRHGNMRSRQVITSHLDAFGMILKQNGFSEFPRLFIPPALNHSFGNGSMQALLYEYGIRHVVTRFSRARRFTPPIHEMITWECGVGLLERGLSPVPWNMSACPPGWDFSGPILPLHWGNLLHPDPERNRDIVDGWAEMLLAGTAGPESILAENYDTCWRQAAIFYFGKLSVDGESVVIDLTALPKDMPDGKGPFSLKILSLRSKKIHARGSQVLSEHSDGSGISTLQLLSEKEKDRIRIVLS
jgi:hypothetical protein